MNAVTAIHANDTPVSLEIFPSIPKWARAHALTDGSAMPLFRSGEVAVYQDARGQFPEHGKLYVVEYESAPHWAAGKDLDPPPLSRRSQSLLQAHRRERTDGSVSWVFRTYAGPIHWADGYYPDEMAMARKVLGPVVGIYSPPAIFPAPEA